MTTQLKGFNTRFDVAFTAAQPSSSDVPWTYPVAIAGTGYMLDTSLIQDGTFNHASIPYLEKFLTSPVFGSPAHAGDLGENSLNPDVAWRRSTSTWHKGAGQKHFDLGGSDHGRFRSSKGIDCWTIGQLTLLPDTQLSRSSVNTNLDLILAGSYAYLADGTSLKYSSDLVTWNDAGITTTVNALCSDGSTVYAGLPGGVYSTAVGTGTNSLFSDLVPDRLDYVKGRLMAAKGASVYNLAYGPLVTPTGLQLTVTGTAGTTTYAYRVSALNAGGETLACTEVTIATGPASLSASDGIKLTWNAQTGASSYNVYGRTAGGELLLGSASTNTYTDTGTATPSGALPASNTTTNAPAALFTHPNSSWKWVGFATGDQNIYAAGYAGHYSAVYRIPIKTDGSGLDVPIQAAELPGGETLDSILGYLGQVFLGTSSGLRMCAQASDGGLTVGSVIQTASPVKCLAGYSRFVWFGWTNYDTTSTGLGRADVTVINTDAPAYTSDLMATAQGDVLSVVSLGDKRVFAISGQGVYSQSANLVASGTLDSGLITYDMPDPKIATSIDVKHSSPLVGSHSIWLSADEGTFALLGTHTSSSDEGPFSAQNKKAEVFEVRIGIGRDSTNNATGPTLSRWTLMAVPAAESAEYITVPILLATMEQLPNGSQRTRNNLDRELAALKALRLEPRVFTYQEGPTSYRCTMADYTWLPKQQAPNKAFEGTFVAKLLVQA